jgi:hypothetical protein
MGEHIACTTGYLVIADTAELRVRYGRKSPPVAGVTPG